MQSLLVCGYCREIEQVLVNQIIPITISELCLMFYKSCNFIFCISHGTVIDIEITDIDAKKMYTSNITSSKLEAVNPDGSAKCCHPEITLPSTISNQYFNSNQAIKPQAIFVCGGLYMSEIHAILCDPMQLQQDNTTQEIEMFDWKLPSIENSQALNGSYAVFSENHGLIMIGGCGQENNDDRNECWKLSFNDTNYLEQNLIEWKWQKMENMKDQRYRPSATLIDKKNNNEKLIVLGGSYEDYENEADIEYPKTMEIFDFESKQWGLLSDCKIGKCTMGIFYDEIYNDRLYVGGGVSYLNDTLVESMDVAFYDIIQNKWYQLPQTKIRHQEYPIFWIQDGNIVYIASGFGVESLDLRQDNAEWMSLKDHIASIDSAIGEVWRIKWN